MAMNNRQTTNDRSVVTAGDRNGSGTETLFKRILRIIFPDQRKQQRIPEPPLVGYLGTVRGSKPFEVGDVSLGGFSLLTDERWEPGTEMPITLHRTNVAPDQYEDRFTVQATVARWAEGGVGFSILLSEEESNAAHGNPLQVRWASKQEMQFFLERMKASTDQFEPALAGREACAGGGASLRAAFSAGHAALTHSAGD